jgi:hypothetical protein
MMREYFIRGERKTVEEIDDVVAVKVAANASGQRTLGHSAFGAEARAQDTGMDAETTSAFADARWLFVQPSPATRTAMASTAAIPEADLVGTLVKRPSGRFGVVTKRLNVQLQESLSEQAAEQALSEHGLVLRTRLLFAPNLFEVDATKHDDALAASVELSKDARFTLAEPSLVEHVPLRMAPTDPRYVDQWQWSNTGQLSGAPGGGGRVEHHAWGRRASRRDRQWVPDQS